jgi:hypothetical protein
MVLLQHWTGSWLSLGSSHSPAPSGLEAPCTHTHTTFPDSLSPPHCQADSYTSTEPFLTHSQARAATHPHQHSSGGLSTPDGDTKPGSFLTARQDQQELWCLAGLLCAYSDTAPWPTGGLRRRYHPGDTAGHSGGAGVHAVFCCNQNHTFGPSLGCHDTLRSNVQCEGLGAEASQDALSQRHLCPWSPESQGHKMGKVLPVTVPGASSGARQRRPLNIRS